MAPGFFPPPLTGGGQGGGLMAPSFFPALAGEGRVGA